MISLGANGPIGIVTDMKQQINLLHNNNTKNRQ